MNLVSTERVLFPPMAGQRLKRHSSTMPIPPPPPGGPPPAPALSQSVRCPPAAGRGALLSDICRGTKLRKVTDVKDRSAPQLNHAPHQPQSHAPQHGHAPQHTLPSPQSPPHAHTPDKMKAGGATAGSANGSAATSPTGAFQSGASKLRASADGCSGRAPRAAAPRPPSIRHDNTDGPAPSPAPPPQCRRGNAPSPPVSVYNREKPLPPTPPTGSKPRPPTSGGNPAPCTLAPPAPHFHGNGAESSPDLPKRQNSLNKRPAPSPSGHTPPEAPPLHLPAPPTTGPQLPAPPTRDPPPASKDTPPLSKDTPPLIKDTPPPNKDPPTKAAEIKLYTPPPEAPPAPVMSSPRPGCREAPPPPPGRTHGSPAPSDPSLRGKPPPPPRTPQAPPPPPPPAPPHRNGPASPRICSDDFESKYSFHPLADFPPPEEYRHFTKIYPSKANRVMRGAPPLPPVAR
ncbi:hypothetical protein WMY93_001626 [Mugilogobius chulae]|uniref:WH2 domain-containing protein n=1 Tax=Mugilogobius chulae TaxID=88201 RepID=A0AAW0PZS8_9GOBI